jgi:hypothetical protein
MPTGKRSPGWRDHYDKARRAADSYLRNKYADEWRAVFDAERSRTEEQP